MKNENTVEKVLEIKVRYDDAIRNIAKYRAATATAPSASRRQSIKKP